ncbi:hypothetical protein E2562_009718 [Oryza meyeriana var. granulata]|uniref:Uncharacterized protein n=1 Tax=Oryza meyeriana var. granulata TaxID=110450 RepID=A0A6G1D207_9ORYZ|nr:hypothetical protein E2562_009718 [Oryza meyeriana var. granulata]
MKVGKRTDVDVYSPHHPCPLAGSHERATYHQLLLGRHRSDLVVALKDAPGSPPTLRYGSTRRRPGLGVCVVILPSCLRRSIRYC